MVVVLGFLSSPQPTLLAEAVRKSWERDESPETKPWNSDYAFCMSSSLLNTVSWACVGWGEARTLNINGIQMINDFIVALPMVCWWFYSCRVGVLVVSASVPGIALPPA